MSSDQPPGSRRFAVDPSISEALNSIRRSMTHPDVRKDPADMAGFMLGKVEAAATHLRAAQDDRQRDAAAGALMEACFNAGYWRRTLGAGAAKAFGRAEKRAEKERNGASMAHARAAGTAPPHSPLVQEIIGKHAAGIIAVHPSYPPDRIAKSIRAAVNKELRENDIKELGQDAIRKRIKKSRQPGPLDQGVQEKLD
jgi:hypothetical protein